MLHFQHFKEDISGILVPEKFTFPFYYEPHQLAYYLKNLANDFHTYYNANQFIVDDDIIRNARLTLIEATKQVIQNGLSLLGVTAPEVM